MPALKEVDLAFDVEHQVPAFRIDGAPKAQLCKLESGVLESVSLPTIPVADWIAS